MYKFRLQWFSDPQSLLSRGQRWAAYRAAIHSRSVIVHSGIQTRYQFGMFWTFQSSNLIVHLTKYNYSAHESSHGQYVHEYYTMFYYIINIKQSIIY